MNLFSIALKSIKQRALASSLTALSVALGVMLMVAVMVIFGIVDRTFNQNSIGYDLIVGPKGSDLQLVLSSVYRVSPPIENLPYRYYEQLLERPEVAEAVPIALGDSTEEGGFPIVGTISRYFELEYAPDKFFRLTNDSQGMGGHFDSLIGSHVAATNKWKVGSKFKMVHAGQDDHVHDEEFTVVGILAPTGTANDKSVFVNLEGFYMIEGHDKPREEARKRWGDFFGKSEIATFDKELAAHEKEHGGHDHSGHDHSGHDHGHHHAHATPDVLKEVSAIFLKMARNPNDPPDAPSIAGALFSGELKKGFQAQGVNPIIPMMRLKTMVVGNIQTVLLVMTVLIIIVSGVSIFVSIYNSMSDRKREIAVMRALGARRGTVFSIILLESVLLCVGGGVLGVLLGHGLVFIAAPIVQAESGLLINPLAFESAELVVLPVMIILASLVGFIPGMTAYRTDVAQTLAQ